uniref:Uncharacterized protein n=1 Tax=Chromera velia CCMP2878 TaxID=1169474 RepID=A0A0G4HLI1_9ALVE|eukprot:Cvel_7356.t1-p1 / transcript=Cvel_7356.t1 / gene=Cvel_7356 / organism=Chromera_velia_CCMP2878 / gene_product=hypothetical protein / transcript_product=hypothetical protein / location=Cvel_scaffold382:12059-12256(+) / protein_length=66 / sequence_SO=supercontig / SO=protein_coding / is_pseudo=false
MYSVPLREASRGIRCDSDFLSSSLSLFLPITTSTLIRDPGVTDPEDTSAALQAPVSPKDSPAVWRG